MRCYHQRFFIFAEKVQRNSNVILIIPYTISRVLPRKCSDVPPQNHTPLRARCEFSHVIPRQTYFGFRIRNLAVKALMLCQKSGESGMVVLRRRVQYPRCVRSRNGELSNVRWHVAHRGKVRLLHGIANTKVYICLVQDFSFLLHAIDISRSSLKLMNLQSLSS